MKKIKISSRRHIS